MSAKPAIRKGDRFLVRVEVVSVDPVIGWALAKPIGADGGTHWYEPERLLPDHLTPPPRPQTDAASD